MAKYRKKPVVVEATQWFKNGDHTKVLEPLGDERAILLQDNCKQCKQSAYLHGWIDTLEGSYIVCPSDWIITGVKGEHYPCKPDIFEETYEKVEATSTLVTQDNLDTLLGHDRCPKCHKELKVYSSDEGTHSYIPCHCEGVKG